MEEDLRLKDILAEVGVAEESLPSFDLTQPLPEMEDEDENAAPSWGDAATAWLMNESLIGAAIDGLGDLGSYEDDPDFLAVRHMRENQDSYQDVMDKAYEGYFNKVSSPEELDAMVADLRQERQYRKSVDNSTLAQTLILGSLTGLSDVALPGGMVGKAVRTGAVSGAAAIGLSAGLGTSVSEIALQSAQQERTITESVINTTTATGIGALLGGAFGRLAAKTPLTDKIDEGLRQQRPVQVLPGVPSINRSVGAAEASQTVGEYAERSKVMKALDATMSYLPFGVGKSPAVVAARAELNETRDFFNLIADTGILTKDQEKGLARVEASAEEIREWYQTKASATQLEYDKVYFDLNVAMGDTGAALNLRSEFGGGKVSRNDFDREVYMSMVLEDYVPEDPVMAAHVKRAARTQTKFYKEFWDEGVRAGIFSGKSNYKELYLPQLWNRQKIMENPAEFKRWMLDHFEQKFDEDWLQVRKGMTMDEFEALDDAGKQTIRDEFNSENDIYAFEKAEAAYHAALEKERTAREVLKTASGWARKTGTREIRSRIKAAAVDAKFIENKRNLFKSEAMSAKADADTFMKATETLRRAELARKEALVDSKPFTDQQFKVYQARQKAAQDLEDFWAEPKNWMEGETRPVHGSSKSQRTSTFNRKALADKLRAYEKFEQDWLTISGRGVDTAADPRVDAHLTDPRYNFLKGQAEEAARNAQTLSRRAKQLEDRFYDLTAKMYEANAAEIQAKEAKKAWKEAKAKAEEAYKKATRERKAAETKMETARDKGISTKDLVDGIVESLTDSARFPSGVLYDGGMGMTTPKTGRSKFRGLQIKDPKLLRQLLDSGYLRSDIPQLGERYARELGGRLGLREKFGTDDIKEIVGQLDKVYRAKVEERQLAGDMKGANRLLDEWKDVAPQLEMMVKKELGTWDAGSAANMGEHIAYFGRMARMANTLRYMGAATISSITDLAVGSLQQSPASQLARAFGSNVSKTVKEMNNRELAVFLFAAENNPGMARAAQLYSIDDMVYEMGFGKGVVRKISAGAEQGTQKMVEKLFTLNFMREWNGRLSYAAGTHALDNIMQLAEKVRSGGQLTSKEMRDMAFAGFDEMDMRKMAELNEKYGDEVANGIRFPDIDKWRETPEGAEIARRLMLGLNRVSKRSVIRVGTADLPPFVSSAFGKILFQFQSFGYAAVNKWARNMDVMARNGEVGRVVSSILMSLALGTAAFVAREGVINNEWGKVEEKLSTPAGLMYEAVDRGGLLFILNPYFNALGKFANARGVPVEEWGLLASRYGERTPLSALAGPTVGLGQELQMLATEKDADKAMDRLGYLMPYRNLFWLDAVMNRIPE